MSPTSEDSNDVSSESPDLSIEAYCAALDAYMAAHPGKVGEHVYGETDKYGQWNGSLVIVSPADGPRVDAGDGFALPAHVTIRRGETVIEVDLTGEHPRYVVTLETRSPATLRRLHLLPLVTEALSHVVTTTKEHKKWNLVPPRGEKAWEAFWRDEGLSERLAYVRAFEQRWNERDGPIPPGTRLKDVAAAQRVVRRKATRATIEQAADAYRTGRLEGVKASLLVGDRQAWRYIAKAQELGLLPRERTPRTAEGQR